MKIRVEATSVWHDDNLFEAYPILAKFKHEYVNEHNYIVIDSLEDLINLMDECKEELVLQRHWDTNELLLEIYDTYRE